jgi:hypothetical protein
LCLSSLCVPVAGTEIVLIFFVLGAESANDLCTDDDDETSSDSGNPLEKLSLFIALFIALLFINTAVLTVYNCCVSVPDSTRLVDFGGIKAD